MTNPILAELNNLSPGAKAALAQAHGQATTQAAAQPPTLVPNQSPAKLPPAVGRTPSLLGGSAPPPMPATLTPPKPGPAPITPADGHNATPTLLPPPSSPSVLAPRGTIPGEENEVARLVDSGSGIHQIKNPLLKGLAGVGNAVGHIVAPGLMRAIPGTEEHHQSLLGQAAGNAGLLQGLRGKDTANGLQQAQTAEQEALAGKTNEDTAEAPQKLQSELGLQAAQAAEAAARAGGEWSPVANFTGPNGEPMEVNKQSGQFRIAPGVTGAKPLRPPVDKPDTPEQQFIDEFTRTHPNATIGEAVHAYAAASQKPPIVSVNAGNAALDRETTRFAKPYETGIAAANDQLEKIADAEAMIRGNAESQALGVPKVLTALVSGKGSGVRITMPELQLIANARGIRGDIEGTLNNWAGKGRLSAEQQKQLVGIMEDVKKRLLAKQAIYNDALDAINGAGSREDVLKAEKDARQRISALETAGGGSGGKSFSLKQAMSLPFNKGKSEADVKSDLQKHGYTVTP